MRSLRYLGLFAFALVVRLVYVAEWSDTALFSVLLGDGRQYDLWAHEVAGGDWFGREVFYQAPMYPYFLALVHAVTGHDLWALRLAQCLVGSASCVLLALAGRRFFDERVGFTAGVLLALYAPAIYFDGLIQKGVLGGFFMVLLLFVLGEFRERVSWPWLLGAGATLGTFALTRENALILPPIVAAWLVLRDPKESVPRRAAWVAILVAGLAIVLVPVGLRNQKLGGRFLITTSQLGPNFYIGNHDGANGRYLPLREGRGDVRFERLDATELAEAAVGHSLTPAEISRYWLDRAKRDVAADPAAWAGLLMRKSLLVWNAGEVMDTDSLEAYSDSSVVLRVLGAFLHFGFLAPLGVFGIWATRKDWNRLWLLYAVLLAMAAAVALFYVMARYRYPLVPILALFAAAGVLELARLWRTRDWRGLAGAGALITVAGVVCNWPLHADVNPRTITYYSLGAALVDEGRLEEAVVQFERALDVDPEFVEARFKLGDALTHLGQPDRALAHLEEAVRIDPEHADSRVGLGSALLALGRAGDAAEQYLEAIRLDPGNASAHNNLAVLLARQGRLEEAVPHWERALESNPADADAAANLGQVLMALGETSRARSVLEQALQREPTHARARYLLATLLQQQGQARDAIKAYRLALEATTDGEGLLRVRIVTRLARMLAVCDDASLRDGVLAVRLAEQAARSNRTPNADLLDSLAAAYAETGHFEAAASTVARAIELARGSDPDLSGELEERLGLYRARTPWRISCRAPAP